MYQIAINQHLLPRRFSPKQWKCIICFSIIISYGFLLLMLFQGLVSGKSDISPLQGHLCAHVCAHTEVKQDLKAIYISLQPILQHAAQTKGVHDVFILTYRYTVLGNCQSFCCFPVLPGKKKTQTITNRWEKYSFEFHIAVWMTLKGFYKFTASII